MKSPSDVLIAPRHQHRCWFVALLHSPGVCPCSFLLLFPVALLIVAGIPRLVVSGYMWSGGLLQLRSPPFLTSIYTRYALFSLFLPSLLLLLFAILPFPGYFYFHVVSLLQAVVVDDEKGVYDAWAVVLRLPSGTEWFLFPLFLLFVDPPVLHQQSIVIPNRF